VSGSIIFESVEQVGRHYQIAVVARVRYRKSTCGTKNEYYKQAREVLQRRFEPAVNQDFIRMNCNMLQNKNLRVGPISRTD